MDEVSDAVALGDAASDELSESDGDALGVDVVEGGEEGEDGVVAGGVAEAEPESPPDGEVGGAVGEELVEGGLLGGLLVVEPAGAVALCEPVAPVPVVELALVLELAAVVAA